VTLNLSVSSHRAKRGGVKVRGVWSSWEEIDTGDFKKDSGKKDEEGKKIYEDMRWKFFYNLPV